jgi:hypothetical protein
MTNFKNLLHPFGSLYIIIYTQQLNGTGIENRWGLK